MKSLIFACLLFLSLALPAFCAPPDTCLQQISDAIENENSDAFQQAIDIDALLNQSMDLFLKQAQKNDLPVPPMLALLLAQINNTQAGKTLRNVLLQEAKAFILNGVDSGTFAGREPNAKPSQGYLAPLFANVSTGRKEIRGVGEPVAASDGWLMPFSLHDYGNGSDYLVVGKFSPANASAKLVGIENLEQLFEQIKREASGQ